MNHSTNTKGTNADHALWVGDLSADVDDYGLYKCFAARYNTIQLAKGTVTIYLSIIRCFLNYYFCVFKTVVRSTNGESRGYAFVNFTSETDYKDALTHMQGHRGLGSNPLRVSLAIPRNYNMIPGSSSTNSSTTSSLTASLASTIVQAAAAQNQAQSQTGTPGYGQYMDPSYWQQQQQQQQQQQPQYGAWPQYGYQGYYEGQTYPAGQYGAGQAATNQPEEDEFELIEHNTPVDIEKLNRELFERNQDLWDTLEDSRWSPFNPEKVVPTAKTEENGTAAPAC